MKNYTLTRTTLLDFPIKQLEYFSKEKTPESLSNPQSIIIHDTKTLNTLEKVYAQFEKKNYFTIGYHIMIGKNGQYYLTKPLNEEGNHTPHFNNSSIGIAVFGNFNKDLPNQKQIDSLKTLIKKLKQQYPIKEILTHTQAIYSCLEKNASDELPSLNKNTFKDEFSYYSFLKDVEKNIPKEKNNTLRILFNEMKTCPGIHLQKKIFEMEI